MNQKVKVSIAKRISIISGIFTALIGILLLLNYIQISSSDPLDSLVLKSLTERLSSEPGNQELIDEIRQLDFLARKAYFNSLWQIRTMSYILLFSAIVFIVSLRIYSKATSKLKVPVSETQSTYRKTDFVQNIIIVSAAVIIIPALISAYFSVDYLKIYQSDNLAATVVEDENGIERVKIVSRATETETELIIDAAEYESDTITTTEKPVEIFTDAAVRQNHNSFRGPWGNAVSYHKNIPDNWDINTGKNIKWKTEIPIHGYNSPVIWDDKMFLSGADDNSRVVYCIDINSGNILWERKADNIPGSPSTPPKTTDDTGLAAASLTTDGKRVFAIFGTGDIIAFDFSGKRVWARNLGVPANHYGHSSSLITRDNKIFVQYDTQRGSRVLALDNETGKTVWESARTDDVSWSSPILAKVNEKYQLILLSLPGLSGYDISNGKQLWYVQCMSGEVGTSPAYGGGLVYAANEYAKMVAVDPMTGEIKWEDNYYLPEVSSPVYYDGLVYVATTFAVIACFEAQTGEFLWEYDTKTGFYSSPIIADGKLYVFDLDGNAYIFNPGREPNLLFSTNMGEPVFATPAFSQGRMYIRTNNYLYCIGK